MKKSNFESIYQYTVGHDNDIDLSYFGIRRYL